MSWSIDGIEWKYPCTIERVAEVTASDISGMMLNKTYFNDVMGTWMKYTVAIAIPKDAMDEYGAIYDQLTAPVNYHTFVLPYNDEFISLTAKVDTVSDAWVRLPHDRHYWRKTKFDIIATAPSREATQSGTYDHGIAPFPTAPTPTVGAIYEWTADGWERKEYTRGDDIYY
jgi:hypothetical protein